MNKKIFVAVAALFCLSLLAQWNFDDKAGLKFFYNGNLILQETGLTKHDFAGNNRKSPYISAERTVKAIDGGYRIAVNAEFNPLDFAPEYGLFIPADVINGARITAVVSTKKGRVPQVVKGDKWTLNDVVFLVVEKAGLKFALDFEWTGSMAYQHYRDEAWAALLERRKNGLNIRLPRRYVGNLGGFFTANIALRTKDTDFAGLHGDFQAHYKVNLPVKRLFKFTPAKERPSSIGGVVTRDDDVKIITKRFSKAVLVPVTRGIPAKFGGGGWSAGKYLKFNANKTDNTIYSHAAVGGSREQKFTMKLPDGYYFLTFMVRDDSVKTPKTYQVAVNGRKYTVPVDGASATATRCVVKVTGGELKIDFLRTKTQWHISALSAVWLCGLGDADIDVAKMKEFQL